MVTKSKTKNTTPTKSASTAKTSAATRATAKVKATAVPKPDFKAAAAADHAEPATTADPKAAPKAEPKKEEEKLGTKLRRKGDIMNALRTGSAMVLTTEGLYRMVNPDGTRNPVSKRRAAAIVAAGLVKLTKTNGDGKHYVFDSEAEKASEKEAEPKAVVAESK